MGSSRLKSVVRQLVKSGKANRVGNHGAVIAGRDNKQSIDAANKAYHDHLIHFSKRLDSFQEKYQIAVKECEKDVEDFRITF